MTDRAASSSYSRVQEAIALAKSELDPQKKLILTRIAEQRLRLKTRDAAQARHLLAQEKIEQRSLLQIANSITYGNTLLQAGRDFALQHPIAVGFALGVGIVVAPRRLFSTTLRVLPLILRFSR